MTLQLDEVSAGYGPFRALFGISIEVPENTAVALVGPNGAGKSTTMRMLTCYLPPTGGTATINGFDIFHQSQQVRQSLGYLPESVPLYTEMRVEEYLDFRGRLRKMDRAARKQRIDYVCERCWLTSSATILSGGP